MEDYVDSVCVAAHQTSKRFSPVVGNLLQGCSAAKREVELVWILTSFMHVSFDDCILYETSSILDCHNARDPQEKTSRERQVNLLAAVCLAVKIRLSRSAMIPLGHLIMYFGRDEILPAEVYQAEFEIWKTAGFRLKNHTAHDFLLFFRPCVESTYHLPELSELWSLAEFLLQLTLADARLHYRYSHCVLAAGVLALSLYTFRAPPAAFSALIEDLAVYFSAEPEQNDQLPVLLHCTSALHAHWVRSVGVSTASFAGLVVRKFAVANKAPPELPPMALPPHVPEPWNPVGVGQATSRPVLDEAIDIVRRSFAGLYPAGQQRVRCLSCGFVRLLTQGTCFCGVSRAISEDDVLLCADDLGALRGPAERSEEVRGVLTRFPWTGSCFWTDPDRLVLLGELSLIRFREEDAEAPPPALAVFAADTVLVPKQQLYTARWNSSFRNLLAGVCKWVCAA
eukprot:TRINITY_DN50330_c0_g1_i1.p1 TRINITY_DN50330_c0_g1~~TRINITY_DN50330_c0_g1_i1.p1  ORF type:complete len:515 (-),score=57.84 TRINITY_DN50330_c0_g1_i1:27-1385(-)